MFRFNDSPVPVPNDLPGLMSSVWDDISTPGSGWTGSEKLALANASRMARSGNSSGQTSLPHGAIRAVEVITTEPSAASKQWVDRVTKDIGEPRYIELVGVVAAVTGVDAITQYLGSQLEPLPVAKPGRLVPDVNPGARAGKAWVSMEGPPLPRNALSAVPRSPGNSKPPTRSTLYDQGGAPGSRSRARTFPCPSRTGGHRGVPSQPMLLLHSWPPDRAPSPSRRPGN